MTPDQKPSRVFTEAPQSIIASEARKDGILRFTPEQKSVLENEGYMIRELTGKSLDGLKRELSLYSLWGSHDAPMDLPSMKSEVAVNMGSFFIPKSDCKLMSEKQSLLRKFSKNISMEIPGVEAVMGEVTDYAELGFLLGCGDYESDYKTYSWWKNNSVMTRTRSLEQYGNNNGVFLTVDHFHYNTADFPYQFSPFIEKYFNGSRYEQKDAYVVPLIVPAKSK